MESCYTSRPIERTTPRCAVQVEGGRRWLAISPAGGIEASSRNGFKAAITIAGSSVVVKTTRGVGESSVVVKATRGVGESSVFKATRGVGESSVVIGTKSSIVLNFDRIRTLGLEVSLLLTVGAGHTRNYMPWLNKSKDEGIFWLETYYLVAWDTPFQYVRTRRSCGIGREPYCVAPCTPWTCDPPGHSYGTRGRYPGDSREPCVPLKNS